MQKKASIPPCFSTVLGGKTGGTVPKKGEHSVFFFVFPFRYAMQCNTLQCHTIQYSTLRRQYPKNGGTAQRWKKLYVLLCAWHTVSSGDRHATQPRRKERSSANNGNQHI